LTTIFFLFLLVFALSACSQSSNKPGIKIKPQQTDLTAGDVTVTVDVSNFELLKEGENQTGSEKGYIVY